MPFFLVTHRSLVEADSDQDAAVKALEKIDRGRKLEFEVKFDEATITRVLIERKPDEPGPPPPGGSLPGLKPQEFNQWSPEVDQTDQRPSESSSRPLIPERPSARTTAMVSIFLGGLFLATFLIGAL